LRPFGGLQAPYHRYFTEPPTFRGPGREVPDPKDVKEVRLGVLVPLSGEAKAAGTSMLRGIQLALSEANAEGGYRKGVPFREVVRNESVAWGAAANAGVDLVYRHDVRALLGALMDENSHVLTRLLLKVEVPMINTGGTDPTLTEHAIPWLVRMRPDDRQVGYALARRIFKEKQHRRVAVLRANDRYARMGIGEFNDAARRLHSPIAVEVRFGPRARTFERQVERLKRVKPDAIVLWGEAAVSGRALKALRAAGLKQPVYGPDRLASHELIEAAGKAAEGLVFVYPFRPGAAGERWTRFEEAYRQRYEQAPDATAAYGYDGARFVVEAIRKVGLNRVLIRDAMFERTTFPGVTGVVRFDSTGNNVAEVGLGHVENGALIYD
jgi:branched-chain amino acid transport system substrate-binding protein